jgi:CxxC motif-containing protein
MGLIMNEIKEFVCTVCPNGCILRVETENKNVLNIGGNTCKRGEIYGREEAVNPMRILTSTVKVTQGDLPVVSVKTNGRISKSLLFDMIKECNLISVPAPVKIGDVFIKDVLNTGVDIVATKNIGLFG